MGALALLSVLTATFGVAVSTPAYAKSEKSVKQAWPGEPMTRVTDVKEPNPTGPTAAYATTQWGLDRVDQHLKPLDGQYNPIYGYGNGVNAYVVDTGVQISHAQFQGRASNGWDFVENDAVAQDCHGHGTHVAGLVAGVSTGTARYANIKAVRVLDCSGNGTQTTVINGLNWVKNNHVKPAVVNMSIGFWGGNAAVDLAVNQLISAGVSVVLSAGNEGGNACSASPAKVPAAITVGNITSSDYKNVTSNFGTCLDLFAPGTTVQSACLDPANVFLCYMTGTSMAAPAVAGVVALYLRSFPTATPASISTWLVNRTTPGVVMNPGVGSPNKLLYIGA